MLSLEAHILSKCQEVGAEGTRPRLLCVDENVRVRYVLTFVFAPTLKRLTSDRDSFHVHG